MSNILKTTNVTNLTKFIQESSYRVLQVTSKQKTLKQPVYFLKQLNFALLLTFKLTLFWLYFGKSFKTTRLRKSTGVSQNTPKFISIRPSIMKYRSFKNMKNLCFLATPFSKNKLLTFGIFNESNIWPKVYHIWKIEVYGSTVVEITDRRSCYFSSLRIVQINLITSTKKQQ